MFVPTYIVCLIIFHSEIVSSYTNECVLPNTCTSVPDYYWRDYVGIVPPDAIKGGQDEGGNTTYIGQILPPDSKGILPAVIYPGKREAVSAAGLKRFTDAKYVKILCSMERDKFEWRQVNVKELHLLADFHLVLGGFETELPLYVGRAYFEGELLVGKVFDDTHWARGIRLPTKGGGEQGFLDFQILVYPRKCRN